MTDWNHQYKHIRKNKTLLLHRSKVKKHPVQPTATHRESITTLRVRHSGYRVTIVVLMPRLSTSDSSSVSRQLTQSHRCYERTFKHIVLRSATKSILFTIDISRSSWYTYVCHWLVSVLHRNIWTHQLSFSQQLMCSDTDVVRQHITVTRWHYQWISNCYFSFNLVQLALWLIVLIGII